MKWFHKHSPLGFFPLCAGFCLFFGGAFVVAQRPPNQPGTEIQNQKPEISSTPVSLQPVSPGYGGVFLGMGVDEVKGALVQSGVFGYRGERDVSLLPTQERVLIETSGGGFLSRCWFQFYQEKLYIMIMNMNQEKVDFYSIFQSLRKKYGEPVSVSPEKIVWQDEKTIMSLERPLSLKYVDAEVFRTLQENSKVRESAVEITQKNFLDSL